MHLAASVHGAPEALLNIRQNTPEPVSPNWVVPFDNLCKPTGSLTIQAQHNGNLKLYEACQYLDQHNAVLYYARILAAQAMEETLKHVGCRPEVTPTVRHRYERALYILQFSWELFTRLDWDEWISRKVGWRYFWRSLPPWEHEEVYCVKMLLDWHIGTGKSTRS